MTVGITSSRTTPAIGDGANKAWPFVFKVDVASDLNILHLNAAGVETEITTDFTVVLNADQETTPGGTITYPVTAAAIPNTEYITVVRDKPYDQGANFTFGANFSQESVEAAFDDMSMQIQQLKEKVDRTPIARINDADGFTHELPVPAANQYLAINATNDGYTFVSNLTAGSLTVSNYIRDNVLNLANAAALLAEINGAGLGANTFTGTQTVPALTSSGLITTKDLKATDTVYFNEETDGGNSVASQTINWTQAQKRKITLAVATTTFSFTAPAGPCNLVLKMVQDGTGSRAVAWPATVFWTANIEPTWSTTAGKTDLIFIYYDGTNYHCSPLLDSS